ncbi:hypothetical protein A2773_04850 [Candidatus Gottesmanbacteria bacterium RIFCSPHIGHO2_01_FULL_39_10]|uniref:PABS domain-containing protein n=1 Tax=Candidatus Gottesmanbacteria bacterium RIFCSPHIGHO2_01_FULL_39_10 TaxID=1798375 RepID=A0A1F5ZRQ1_9BACT|nr:MAG: hypothetical protein A2773_04850 [Candidatus Gottesmanbacteria bacterium RIFCSPHIGHO2_01_FULL_39_10]
MKLLDWFIPQIVETIPSDINGEIKVVKLYGNYSLSVDGLTQSGGLVKDIWEKTLNKLPIDKLLNNVLVLGVGGGTVIQILKKRHPYISITGIEIDPKMLDLAKKYFGLSETERICLIIADAIHWVSNYYYQNNLYSSKFDLILVDLFIGKKIPSEFEGEKFLSNLKGLLNPQGVVIINLLKDNPSTNLDLFIAKLKNIFSDVSYSQPLVNYIIYCS